MKVLWGVSAFLPLASPLPSPCHMYQSRASESRIERVAQPTSRPPTHARLSLARDALPIATLKWRACSLSCLSQILTFRVLHVSEV